MTPIGKAKNHGHNIPRIEAMGHSIGEQWRDRQEEAVQKRLATIARRKAVTLPKLSFS